MIFAMSLASASAVLVTGLPGSGKTALLRELLSEGTKRTRAAADAVKQRDLQRPLASSRAAALTTRDPSVEVCIHRHARAFGLVSSSVLNQHAVTASSVDISFAHPFFTVISR